MNRHNPVSYLKFWAICFLYAVFAALFFQKILLPMSPSLHAVNGLIGKDSLYFHLVAIKIAEAINTEGWGAWSLWSDYGTGGNVALAAILYAFFGCNPALMIPVNAFFHASGGLLVFMLGRELWPGKVGNYGGGIAALFFVIFPTSLIWYGQLHKDSYSILGSLLILFVWIWGIRQPPSRKTYLSMIIVTFVGTMLLAFVRPYYVKLFFVFGAGLCVFISLFFWRGRRRAERLKLIGCYISTFLVLWAGTEVVSLLEQEGCIKKNLAGTLYSNYNFSQAGWEWQNSPWLPDILEDNIKLAALTRRGMILHNLEVGANSLIDADETPSNLSEMALYMPRALQIAIFSPFPSSWLKRNDFFWFIALSEMAVWYMSIPGILITLTKKPSWGVMIAMTFSLFFLTIQGVTQPNIGTLFRTRYAYLFVLMLVGLLGVASFFYDFFFIKVKSLKGAKVDHSPNNE